MLLIERGALSQPVSLAAPESLLCWIEVDRIGGVMSEDNMVLRLGDGSLICGECFAREYPDEVEPVVGWLYGKCDCCTDD